MYLPAIFKAFTNECALRSVDPAVTGILDAVMDAAVKWADTPADAQVSADTWIADADAQKAGAGSADLLNALTSDGASMMAYVQMFEKVYNFVNLVYKLWMQL